MSDAPPLVDVIAAGHAGDAVTATRGLGALDERTRAAALGALGRCGALTPDHLRTALSDPSPVVRRRAANLAAGHPEVDLVPTLADADPLVAEMAAWGCGEQVATAAVPALATVATDHREPLVREAAVAALGAIGHDDGLTAILAATRDKPAIRRRAVLALAPFDGPDVDAALQRALTDRDWQVRQAAEDLA